MNRNEHLFGQPFDPPNRFNVNSYMRAHRRELQGLSLRQQAAAIIAGLYGTGRVAEYVTTHMFNQVWHWASNFKYTTPNPNEITPEARPRLRQGITPDKRKRQGKSFLNLHNDRQTRL